MHLRSLIFFAVVATLTTAIPIETDSQHDLAAAEGRTQYNHAAFSAPGPLYAPSSHSYGSPRSSYSPSSRAQVTSYNRRGHSSGGPEYTSGLRLSAPSSLYGKHESRQYAQPAPSYALPPPSSYSGGHHEDNVYGGGHLSSGPKYGAYGPPNHISAQSQLYSQDPNYDPVKDPVSQYADYVPLREYQPKKNSDNRELSIYGYK